MKNLILSIFLLTAFTTFTQLPYNWPPNSDPGWVSNNLGNGSGLDWQSSCNAVTANCFGNYSNNQNTSYTSPSIDASCSNASTIIISFDLSGNIESGWDFLFMEYSTNGGITWTNFYGPGVGLSGNAGGGIVWTLPPIPTSNDFRFRFTFDSDFSVTYSGYEITNFQINCNVQLPIQLIYFDGEHEGGSNIIKWKTSSEKNNDYFTLEKSIDGTNWEVISMIEGAGNSTEEILYSHIDRDLKTNILYYRLKQTDFDGKYEYFGPISVKHEFNSKTIINRVNLLGQEVDKYYKGIVIIYYSDGTIQKIK